MELSDIEPILSRSGVEPPTGTIHPRESRGTANRKQESAKRFISGERLSDFGIAGRHLAGVDRSGRGFNPRPAKTNSKLKVQSSPLNRLTPLNRLKTDSEFRRVIAPLAMSNFTGAHDNNEHN